MSKSVNRNVGKVKPWTKELPTTIAKSKSKTSTFLEKRSSEVIDVASVFAGDLTKTGASKKPVRVDSSNLKSVVYDDKLKKLTIRFNSNRVYEYYKVQKQIYEGLLRANSKGSYFHQFIAKRYDYKEI